MPELSLDEITVKVSEKLRPQLAEEINKAITDAISKLSPSPPSGPAEVHNLKSWDPYCPNCSLPNEHFEGPAKYRCKNCKRPLGNDAEVEKLEKCPYPPCDGDTVELNAGYSG